MSRSYANGRRYAEGTKVSVAKSKAQIEKLLRDVGAERLLTGWDTAKGVEVIQCFLHGFMLRFVVHDPGGDLTPKKKEAERRRVWRVQHLLIKAKIEAVRDEVSTYEREFLAHMVLPDGRTMEEWAAPQLAEAYVGGAMPPLLPGSVS